MKTAFALCGFLFTFSIAFTGTVLSADETDIDFARDIRPILSNACFQCHGPDDSARQADLRLDTEESLTTDRGGYTVVRPGDSKDSELVRRINAVDADERMPPVDSNKSLSQEQKDLLVRWIDQGAPWQQHWSFVPPHEPELPIVQDANWCLNEVDRFILAEIERAGLTPSGDADPYTLVRRLYLDLIGLQPEPEDADAWVDKIWNSAGAIDEAAFASLVEHLLGSPHYGERWGRHWLDLARYADTNGYEKDRERSIWPYRDWVVDALNQDQPYDKFTIEQIAGDMLPEASMQQRIATGFHRNTMLNEEGGIDPLEFRYRAMTDRVATTGTTWLGLTLGCCQCHTHKYDPITQTEYFQIMALLNNADEPYLELPDENFQESWRHNLEQAAQLLRDLPNKWPLAPDGESTRPLAADDGEQIARSAAQNEGAMAAARHHALQAAFEKWLQAERANSARWVRLHPTRASSNLPILTIQDDDSILASGDTAKRDYYQIEFAASDRPVTAIQLEALPDESLPARGPGSTYYEGTLGDFYLVEIEVASGRQSNEFESASETYAKNRFGNNPASAQLSIDGDVQTGWSVDGRQGERHVAVYLLRKPVPAGQVLTIRMTFGRHFASSLGRFRFSVSDATNSPQAREYSPKIANLLRRDSQKLSEPDKGLLLEQFLMSAPELSEHANKIRALRARPEINSTLVLAERPSDHPRSTFRHHRGEYLQPQEQVWPGVPSVLPQFAAGVEANRLSFARWLVSPENPLTSRVCVNRQWATLFGTGLVQTLDDFGLQGAPPSHPQLLDWLAVRFVAADEWSLKRLHKRLVTSHTYRQSSKVKQHAKQVDPDNRLLSYAPRLRLEAEILRDGLLVAAGTLNAEMGGSPVRPPQPKGITELAYGSPQWEASSGAERYRRSIYTFMKRTAPFSMYATFDAPSGEACIAKRTRSNSPLQALTLLNDVMLIDLARAAGARYATAAATELHQSLSVNLEQLFRAVLVRRPVEDELRLLEEYFQTQYEFFIEHAAEARALLASQLVEVEPLAEQAAWTATSRALFALDETQTRE